MNRASRKLTRRGITYGLRFLASGYGPLDARIEAAAFSDVELPVTLATITGHRDTAQAVASLLSFCTSVGRPRKVVICDDGSLTAEDCRTLMLLTDAVEFYHEPVDPHLPCSDNLEIYTASHALGKKLAMLIGLTSDSESPVLYMDTDVLIFHPADHLVSLLLSDDSSPRYMSDANKGAYDNRIDTQGLDPVNSGFLVFPRRMRWDSALTRCCEAIGDPQWFTEQTVVLFAMHANKAEPLPPDQYLLRWDDRRFQRDVAGPGAVARHYVIPVRWRFWIRAYGGYWPATRGGIKGALRELRKSR